MFDLHEVISKHNYLKLKTWVGRTSSWQGRNKAHSIRNELDLTIWITNHLFLHTTLLVGKLTSSLSMHGDLAESLPSSPKTLLAE